MRKIVPVHSILLLLLIAVQGIGCSSGRSRSAESPKRTSIASPSIPSPSIQSTDEPLVQKKKKARFASSASVESPQVQSLDELLLFQPTKFPEGGDWAPTNLRFEDVWFDSNDGTRIHGWYCPHDQPRATILFAHGNAGNVASRAAWLALMQSRMQVRLFILDYRGYGRSEGTPTVEGALEDTRAARKKLSELAAIPESEMLLMGESLGGAFAVQLAAESAPRAVILQSTFSSLKDIASVHFPKLAWLVPATKLDSASQIGLYRGPLLQSHGDADQTIPLASAEKLFRAANEPKELLLIHGADHNNWLTDEYLRRLDEFIHRTNR